MKVRTTLISVAMAVVSVLATASPSHAYSGNSWYRHPTITSAWHCGKTQSITALSAQSCIIVKPNSYQFVVIVRNRLKTQTRTAEAWLEEDVYDYSNGNSYQYWTYCRPSALAANDYSACFGYETTGSVSGLGFQADGQVLDVATGQQMYGLFATYNW